jgi:hypothetical protein
MHAAQRDRLDPPARRRQQQLAEAQRAGRQALPARRASLLPAGLRAHHQAGDLDLDQAVRGSPGHGREQLPALLPELAVVLGAHYDVDPPVAALLVEEVEEVRFPVHHRDQPRLARQRARRLRDVAVAFDPAPALPAPLLAGRAEAAAQHSQRQPPRRRRQRQVQPQRIAAGLVAPDDLQPRAPRAAPRSSGRCRPGCTAPPPGPGCAGCSARGAGPECVPPSPPSAPAARSNGSTRRSPPRRYADSR